MAKSLFTLLYFTLILFSYLDLPYKEEVRESVTYHSYMSECYSVTLYNEYGRVVHRPYSNCINSVQNPIETPLSSPC